MNILLSIVYAAILFIVSNIHTISDKFNVNIPIWIALVVFIIINIFPSMGQKKLETNKLKNCRNGYRLLEIFLISTLFSAILLLIDIFGYHTDIKVILLNVLIVYLIELITFWNGIIRVYISSKQLGIKHRVIGALVGMIPILHLIALFKIIKITKKEVKFENDKILLNKSRKDEQICKTKYPILLVHGVFFRDSRYFDYWGRIPKELKDNGATIFYGNHDSAVSIEESAKELSERIKEIVKQTGCEKVNIIAHSKGGLDSRCAISEYGMDEYVASLTMINTPNRGCEFADYLLGKVPDKVLNKVANTYNKTLKKLGDKKPDFVSAVKDLTHSFCKDFNNKIKKSDKVYYQSVGSKLNTYRGGRFPLNLTNNFVKYFDGANDGLVGEDSFKYGDKYTFIQHEGKRGISHGDMIDLNRENIDGFDVREFFVKLVSELREKGF